jgi:hypothetical protein
MLNANKDLENFRKCVGKNKKYVSEHVNQVTTPNFASINRSIQINTAKLEELLEEEQESNTQAGGSL